MRDLIVTENITLDGVVEATDNWFGPAGSPSEVDQSDHERTGSITLVHALIAAGLVDEFRLFARSSSAAAGGCSLTAPA